MKKKVLFFIDYDLTFFGIANFLQKENLDLYVIYDTHGDKPRSFFETQKLVNFKKFWFLNITKFKNPNLKFLEDFENRLKINIWKNAFHERRFYRYNKFYKFHSDEILSIFEQEIKFFEKILDEIKPDCLCIKTTDWHDNHLLKEICKSKGIKILMLTPARFSNHYAILEDLDKFVFKNNNMDANKNKDPSELLQFLKSNTLGKQEQFAVKNFNAHEFKKIMMWVKNYLLNFNNTNTTWKYYGFSKFTLIKSGILNIIKKKIRYNFLEKNSLKKINNETKFIYFPLHYEPERVLLITASYYQNQLEVITNIAKSMPIDYKLFVKEHPTMFLEGWRDVSFYKKILELPNVELIHPVISSESMIKNCSLIISIFGTTILESAFHKKPAIMLVNASYSYLSNVQILSDYDHLYDVIKKTISFQSSNESINDYLSKLQTETFQENLASLTKEINYVFYFGGLIRDVQIPEYKMDLFLNKHQSIFKHLSDEYYKKII